MVCQLVSIIKSISTTLKNVGKIIEIYLFFFKKKQQEFHWPGILIKKSCKKEDIIKGHKQKGEKGWVLRNKILQMGGGGPLGPPSHSKHEPNHNMYRTRGPPIVWTRLCNPARMDLTRFFQLQLRGFMRRDGTRRDETRHLLLIVHTKHDVFLTIYGLWNPPPNYFTYPTIPPHSDFILLFLYLLLFKSKGKPITILSVSYKYVHFKK